MGRWWRTRTKRIVTPCGLLLLITHREYKSGGRGDYQYTYLDFEKGLKRTTLQPTQTPFPHPDEREFRLVEQFLVRNEHLSRMGERKKKRIRGLDMVPDNMLG